MTTTAPGAPLRLPPVKIDGTAKDWSGVPRRAADAPDLPVLWLYENVVRSPRGFPLTIGKTGKIDVGRVVRSPRALVGASADLSALLTADHQDGLDRVGLLVAGGPFGMKGYLPQYDDGSFAPPANFVGGKLYYVGALTAGDDYQARYETWTQDIPYHTYTMNMVTRQWEVADSRSFHQSQRYFAGASALPGLSANAQTAAAAFARCEAARLLILTQSSFATYGAVSGVQEYFYTGPAPAPLPPHTFSLYTAEAFFGDEPGVVHHFSARAVTGGTAPVDDSGGWSDVAALATTAAGMIPGAAAQRHDSDVALEGDVVAFFGL
jgi:hypothetical protein